MLRSDALIAARTPHAVRSGLSGCGGARGGLEARGGGVGGVDGDAVHARIEGGVALDESRVLGIGGEGLGDLRPRLAGDEDGGSGAGGRLRQALGQGWYFLARERDDDGLALLDGRARPADDPRAPVRLCGACP